jgi:hypothetical protein
MIQISTLFELIHIPTEAEFCIYTKDYYIDRAGNIFEKAPSTDVYEYGDLYIETVSTRYIFRRVYAAYDYCARILDLLRKWNGEGSISIQLETINDFTEFLAEGGFEIIHKHNPDISCIKESDKDGSYCFS